MAHHLGDGDMEVEVGPSSSFADDARMIVRAGPRNIAVFLHKGTFYAIDNACYHHGGPLHNGDIEDLGGHPCIICPWHSYRIALDTGEGLYVGLDLVAKKECVKTKGVKQRTHQVIIRDGMVIVQVKTGGQTIESDMYATMAIANQEQPSSQPTTATNNLRNIHSKGMGVGSHNNSHDDPDKIQAELRRKNSLASAVKTFTSHDVPHVQCIKKRIVNADQSVVQFVFDKVSGFEPKEVIRPGMWLTLELPVTLKDAQDLAQPSAPSTSVVGGRRNSTNTFTVQSASTNESQSVAHQEDEPTPDTHLKRTYSVITATSNGRNRHSQGWFSVAVKNMASPTVPLAVRARLPTHGCGSQWIHERAHGGGSANGTGQMTGPELRLVESGGTFSLAMERTIIARRQGKVLLLTAGIGITPMFASVAEILQDDFARSSGPSLHMLHIHIDSTVAAVPFLPELLTYRKEMAKASVASDPMSYQFLLYTTRQLGPDVPGSLRYDLAPSDDLDNDNAIIVASKTVSPASPNSLNRAMPVEDPFLRGFGHKTLTSLRNTPTLVDESLADMARQNALVYGHRPTKADILGACKDLLGTPTEYVAFICGPEVMIDEWSSVLAAAGVSPQCIITERFDF
eukprot:GILI01021210.1.p1 GENE.GILI01021210.1~~GILI01021210.1.p1  ORF type:complete len:626 (-),score=115.74 GILI01021210.1:133-2010(-)